MRKKYPSIVRALFVLALIVTLTGVLAVMPVSAQTPDIDLSAASGAVDSSITVTVNNFEIDSIVSATFDGAAVPTAPTVVEVETDPDTFSMKIPVATAGAHVITVSNGPQTATEFFTVVPKVRVTSPASKKGPVGTAATVTGTGFAAGYTVKVTIGDANFASAISDSTGAVVATGTIPTGLQAGPNTVTAADLAGNPTEGANQDTFTVTPSLAVSPTGGLAGSKVTITGSGWAQGEVNMQFAGVAWIEANDIPVTADVNGIINVTGVVNPPTAGPGVTEIKGTDEDLNTAVATFTVDPRPLMVTPDSGPMGTTVLIQASNMTPGPAGNVPEDNLTISGTEWNTGVASPNYPLPQPGEINIGTAGQLFPTTLYVPPGLTVGENTIVAIDNGGLVAAGKFTVIRPTLSVSPATGAIGTTATIQGSGWVANSQVTLTFAQSSMTVLADANGNIAAAMSVPGTATAGPNTITAMDPVYTNAAPAATFTVPGAYISIDPTQGSAGEAITISGSGFPGYTPITVTFGDFPLPAQVLTSPLGDFTLAASVPGVAPGSRVVAALIGTNPIATTYYVVQATPETVQTALAGIMNELEIIWGFVGGEWLFYDPNDVEGSDLTNLEKGRGYWLNVLEATELVYGGNSYLLNSGWNNIGWLGK